MVSSEKTVRYKPLKWPGYVVSISELPNQKQFCKKDSLLKKVGPTTYNIDQQKIGQKWVKVYLQLFMVASVTRCGEILTLWAKKVKSGHL